MAPRSWWVQCEKNITAGMTKGSIKSSKQTFVGERQQGEASSDDRQHSRRAQELRASGTSTENLRLKRAQEVMSDNE